LQEHHLEEVPHEVVSISNLRSLDLSKNSLVDLSKLCSLVNLKVLNCEFNKLRPGSLQSATNLSKLQTLNAGNNRLGGQVLSNQTQSSFPELPASLKELKLPSNSFLSIPPQICSANLTKLENLDLSNNSLAHVPPEIKFLKSLVDLNLDNNSIPSLPNEIGELKKLKVLSLRSNGMNGTTSPQPLPPSLFSDTQLIDLNLHENVMTNSQLMDYDGFSDFLERRRKVKTKNIAGGALTDLDTCGLR